MAKNLILWLVIAVVLMTVFNGYSPSSGGANDMSYSNFVKAYENGSIRRVEIEDQYTIHGLTSGGEKFTTYMPLYDKDLLNDLLKHDVAVVGKPPEQPSMLAQIFVSWFPMLLLIGVWIF
ncbi:MAG: ATP-dependent metallopeptidase FtsH/Yme1/Tma family protein, partial [Ferrimonas sp.]